MRSLVLAKLGMSFLCKSLALGENVQKKDGERKRFSESRGMYVCMYVLRERFEECHSVSCWMKKAKGVDRAGRLFTMEGKWENKEKMSRRVHMFLAFWCFFGPSLSLLLTPYSAVDSDIHPIKLWAKSSNVC